MVSMNGAAAKKARKAGEREARKLLATRSLLEEYGAIFAHYCVVANRRLSVKPFRFGSNFHVLIVRAKRR